MNRCNWRTKVSRSNQRQKTAQSDCEVPPLVFAHPPILTDTVHAGISSDIRCTAGNGTWETTFTRQGRGGR